MKITTSWQAPETFEDEGKIWPYPKPGSAPAKAGWKADREADGPDGTSYRMSRGNVFCLVSGSWDGGDDSDPKVVPSPLFLATARCAMSR